MQENSDFKYIFYTTLGCHLCDEAIAMLNHYFNDKIKLIGMCDIANDDTLIDMYGTRIPVLEAVNSGEKLAWPFSQDMLTQFFN